MVIPVPDVVSAATSSLHSTIKILEIIYELKAVDEQTADLLSTTRHVDSMLQHAHRLRRLKAGLLNTSERTMIDTVIGDTEDALRGVARLIEPCRVDKATKNTIGFGHRIMWLIRDNPSVRDKHQMLQICYQSLTTVFNCLFSKDAVVIAPIPEVRSDEPPPPYDPQLKELLNWQSRRRGRKTSGEKSRPSDETGLASGSRDVTPVANSSSPCLLAIDVDDDAGTFSPPTHTAMSSESSPAPTSDAQPSFFSNNGDPLDITTSAPEPNNVSVHLSTDDSLPTDQKQIRTPDSHPNTFTDDFGITYDLPKFDSPPFSAMMADYKFNNDVRDSLNSGSDKRLSHISITASNHASSPSGAGVSTTPSTTSSFRSLPHATLSTPAPLESSIEDAFTKRWFESSGGDAYDNPLSNVVSDPGQHSLPSSIISDTQPISPYRSDRLDAIARMEDVMNKDKNALSVGQGVIKRGGRSWLAYHATRSNTEQGYKWDG